MLGLRLAAGTPMTPTAEGVVASSAGRRFIAAGVVKVQAGRLCVTEPMMTDAVIREALSVSCPDR
jgi:hypothetical protein